MKAIAYIDGSGNSGRIQACAVRMSIGDRVVEKTRILPPHTTNNVGEYSGLLLCLRLAKKLGVEELHVHSDSQLIVNQVNLKWRCRDHVLQKYLKMAQSLMGGFQSVSIYWVPREQNKKADQLCRQAIRQHQKSNSLQISKFSRPRPQFLPSID